MKRFEVFYVLLAIALVLNGWEVFAESKSEKPRTIVTTDGEMDDMDSLIRLLLYSNELGLEGLIYSSSQWHYAGDGKGTLFTSEMPATASRYGQRSSLRWTGTQWMQQLIDKYALAYTNLLKHNKTKTKPI
jgi:hypothetical protein